MTSIAPAWPSFEFDIGLDLFPLTAAVLAAVLCGLLGNFLLVRRVTMMGDAISHSVLPGIVAAFIIAGGVSPAAMFLGATVAGIATVVLVELVTRLGRVEPGAAMGVVFSSLFALGVLMIEQTGSSDAHIDPGCVLYGQLRTLVWFGAPDSLAGLFSAGTLAAVPIQIKTLAAVLAVAAACVVLLYKELRIAAFDPAMATAQGIHAGTVHQALMVLVAAATVASFEAVGSILVVAMLVCPAAAARHLTDRLAPQIWLSLAIAAAIACAGYVASSALPAAVGWEPVNAAGSIAVTGGAAVLAAVLLAPKHGLLSKLRRQRRLTAQIALDDLLAAMYRRKEHAVATSVADSPSIADVKRNGRTARGAIERARSLGYLTANSNASPELTPAGIDAAAAVIRRHRLWEHYLVSEAGVAPDHVHDLAERLEHIPGGPAAGPPIDPHGRPVPPDSRTPGDQ